MSTLIVAVIAGLLFAFFATANTAGVTINIGNYLLNNVPLYLVALGSLLLGLLISWVISLVDSLSSGLSLRSKEQQIKQTEHRLEDLKSRVQELEIENARLKGEHHDQIVIDDREPVKHRPSVMDKIRQNLGFN